MKQSLEESFTKSPINGIHGSGTTAFKVIEDAFSPRIAIISSPDAQSICLKNNLDFAQLITPFTQLTIPGTWQDPTGILVNPKNLKIVPVDIVASWKPPSPRTSPDTTQRKNQYLSNCVGKLSPSYLNFDESDSEISKSSKLHSFQNKSYRVELPASTPWFENWRKEFLRLHPVTISGYSTSIPGGTDYMSPGQNIQHEFLYQFIGCILVISASEAKTTEELHGIIGKLGKLQFQHQVDWPNAWFLSSPLKFYLVLQDSSSNVDADAIYQILRTTYTGNACALLTINSANPSMSVFPVSSTYWNSINSIDQFPHTQMTTSLSSEAILAKEADRQALGNVPTEHPLRPDSPTPQANTPEVNGNVLSPAEMPSRGQLLTYEDIQRVQNVINEFLLRSLFPYVERQTRLLHESIMNRRSMSKSFFGATRRLFGGSAPSSGSSGSKIISYANDSIEVTSRKLADLYFLFGHYTGAYKLYHQLKKDFQGDQAWLHYAASLELAALSHFCMTQSETNSSVIGGRSYPSHYLSEAIRTYLDNCRNTECAIRATLLGVECLKQIEKYGDAAEILIRMTSEESDLRSALMLEQASYAFLQQNSPRKFGLHCVLAGHRFAKAGLRSHSLNAYLQAAQIYKGRDWRFAYDHIWTTLTKHLSTFKPNFIDLLIHRHTWLKHILHYVPRTLPAPPSIPSSTTIASTSTQQQQSLQDAIKPVSQLIPPASLNLLETEISYVKENVQVVLALLKLQNTSKTNEILINGVGMKSLESSNLVKQTFPSISGNEEVSLQPTQSRNVLLQLDPSSEVKMKTIELKWKTANGDLQGRVDVIIDLMKIQRTKKLRLQLFHPPQLALPGEYSDTKDNYKMRVMCPLELQISADLSHYFNVSEHASSSKRRISIEIVQNAKRKEEGVPSSNGVFYIGKTTWIFDFDLDKLGQDLKWSQNITLNAVIFHRGIYNVGPLLKVKYLTQKSYKNKNEAEIEDVELVNVSSGDEFNVSLEEDYSISSPIMVISSSDSSMYLLHDQSSPTLSSSHVNVKMNPSNGVVPSTTSA